MHQKKNNIRNTTFMASVLTMLGAQLAVKLMGLIYRMVITNVHGFGDVGNGFYNAGFQLYTLLLAISSVGIPNAISKLVSEASAKGDYSKSHQIFKTAIFLFFGIGLICSAALYFGSDFIAIHVIKMDGVQYTLQALSPSILFVCLSSVIRGYFLGLGSVSATSRSQMLEQVFKSVLTIVFVLALTSYSAEIMSAGANLATSAATLFSFIFLAVFYFHRRGEIPKASGDSAQSSPNSFRGLAWELLSLSVPISFSSIIMALTRVIDIATITRGIDTAFSAGIPGHKGIPTAEQLGNEAVRLSGMLSKSDTLTNLPLALNIAFATVLVPTISAALVTGNRKEASDKISLSLIISVLLVFPCAVGLIVLAKPIFQLIYPNAPLGYELLQISAISMLFAAIEQTICGSLQGLGKFTVPAKALLCGAAIKICLNLILIRIPSVNIYGAAVSSVICQVTAFLICFYSLRRSIDLNLPVDRYVLKPLCCAAVMGIFAILTYRAAYVIFASNAISVLLSVGLSALIYFVSVLLTHTLSKEEIDELPFGYKLRAFMKRFAA